MLANYNLFIYYNSAKSVLLWCWFSCFQIWWRKGLLVRNQSVLILSLTFFLVWHTIFTGVFPWYTYTFIYTYTGQRPSMLAVATGIVLGSTTARILLGGPRGPGSKAWIKRCDYHKSTGGGDPVALSNHHRHSGHRCYETIRVNNHDFDTQSLEGVTLPRTVAVRRPQ